ncbi:MAG: hypothetical protein OXI72_08950 [Gemmatimonadota bacterium]|nr:hypothetical protein [Gemmatimonadota bacterium]
MLQIRENSIMPQHPFIFIGSLRCCAVALSVASLDHEKVKNGTLAAKIEAATNDLQEYRSALITNAETGKIDVREKAVL